MTSKQDLMQAIGEAMRAYGRANDELDELTTRRAGVNRTDGRLVDILEDDGPMTAGALAGRVGLTTGAITTAIDRLEKAGLARRSADEHDRRKVHVELTEQALGICAEIFGPLQASGFAALDRYDKAELEVILDFMRGTRDMIDDRVSGLRDQLEAESSTRAPIADDS